MFSNFRKIFDSARAFIDRVKQSLYQEISESAELPTLTYVDKLSAIVQQCSGKLYEIKPTIPSAYTLSVTHKSDNLQHFVTFDSIANARNFEGLIGIALGNEVRVESLLQKEQQIIQSAPKTPEGRKLQQVVSNLINEWKLTEVSGRLFNPVGNEIILKLASPENDFTAHLWFETLEQAMRTHQMISHSVNGQAKAKFITANSETARI